MITPEQLKLRKNHIGSSDIAAIMGLNPYATAYDIWCNKIYNQNEQITSDAIDTGNALEPAIVAWTAKRYGLEYDNTPEKLQFICEKHPLFLTHIDALVTNAPTAIEAKYTSLTDEWGDSGTDHIPERVYNQIQLQLLCGGWDYIVVGVWIAYIGIDKRYFIISRNQERIGKIVKIGESWWEKYIITKTPPPIEALPMPETFNRIKRIEGEIVDIPRVLWTSLKLARLQTKQAKEIENKVLAEVKAHIGNAEAGRIPDSDKLYYPRKTKPSVKLKNPELLKTIYPNIYAEFIKEEAGSRWGEYNETND